VKGIPHLAQERIEADRFFYDIGSERPNVVFMLMQEWVGIYSRHSRNSMRGVTTLTQPWGAPHVIIVVTRLW